MRLKLSAEATRDLSAIHEFGALHYGLQQADDYVDELAAALASIERMPFASRERHELRPPIRLRPQAAHNICYLIDGRNRLGRPHTAQKCELDGQPLIAHGHPSSYIHSAARCVLDLNIPGALSILKGAVPDQARGLGHTAPTYLCRFPGSYVPRPGRHLIFARTSQ